MFLNDDTTVFVTLGGFSSIPEITVSNLTHSKQENIPTTNSTSSLSFTGSYTLSTSTLSVNMDVLTPTL